MDFVWTLLDFSMELTKVCVELVWRLCFGAELVWILNFGFIPTFEVILGLIVGWFYAVFFGMFCVIFFARFVPCLWHVLWLQLVGYCGRWTRVVPVWFQVKISMYRSYQGALWHAVAWNPHNCMAGFKISALGYAIAWVSTQLR